MFGHYHSHSTSGYFSVSLLEGRSTIYEDNGFKVRDWFLQCIMATKSLYAHSVKHISYLDPVESVFDRIVNVARMPRFTLLERGHMSVVRLSGITIVLCLA